MSVVFQFHLCLVFFSLVQSSSEGSLKPLTQFAPVSGSWECSSCLVQNTPDAVKCVCCEAKRPGAPSSSSKVCSLLCWYHSALSVMSELSCSWLYHFG